MNERINTSKNLKFDLVDHYLDQTKINTTISSDMFRKVQYTPAIISLRGKVNFIIDESALGKTIANDDRVKKATDLFPALVELYEAQKNLTNLPLIYSTSLKSQIALNDNFSSVNENTLVSNDDNIVEPKKKDDSKVREFPQKKIREPKPVEVKPNTVVPFPNNENSLTRYTSINPIRYANDNFQRQSFYVPSFNGGLVSRIQAANDNNYGPRQKVDFSKHANYYRR